MLGHRAPLFCLVASAAGAAWGQVPDTELRYQVRHFDSGHNLGWADHIVAVPGNHIEVRAVVSFTGTFGVVALGQITFQPLVAGWAANDTLLTNSEMGLIGPGYPANGIGPIGSNITTPPGWVTDEPGVYGRITPWASGLFTTSTFLRGHLHDNPDGTGQMYLRIARADVSNWIGVGPTSGGAAINNTTGGGGVGINQGTIGAGRAANQPPQVIGTQNLIVFKFGFVLGPDTDLRTLTMTSPQHLVGGGPLPPTGYFLPSRWHTSLNSSTPGDYAGVAFVTNAAVHVVPAPGAAWVLGAALLVLRRRPRSLDPRKETR